MKNRSNPTVRETKIVFGDIVVPYVIKASNRAKKIRITIRASNMMEVVIPEKYPVEQVEGLLRQKEKWILTKIKNLQETEKRAAINEAAPVIRYLGKEYSVVTILDSHSPIRVILEGNKAFVTLKSKDQGLFRQVTEAWYRWAAKELFTERTKFWAQRMGVSYQRIFVKNQKTRWGSCSGQGNLNFNLRLIMASLEVIDYIIIHELAHLVEMNHSKRFWQLVETYCPDYKKHIAWLKDYGTTLEL